MLVHVWTLTGKQLWCIYAFHYRPCHKELDGCCHMHDWAVAGGCSKIGIRCSRLPQVADTAQEAGLSRAVSQQMDDWGNRGTSVQTALGMVAGVRPCTLVFQVACKAVNKHIFPPKFRQLFSQCFAMVCHYIYAQNSLLQPSVYCLSSAASESRSVVLNFLHDEPVQARIERCLWCNGALFAAFTACRV